MKFSMGSAVMIPWAGDAVLTAESIIVDNGHCYVVHRDFPQEEVDGDAIPAVAAGAGTALYKPEGETVHSGVSSWSRGDNVYVRTADGELSDLATDAVLFGPVETLTADGGLGLIRHTN